MANNAVVDTKPAAAFNPLMARPSFAVVEADSDALAKALAGSSSFGKRISIKGGVFRLMVDGQEVTSIDERYLDVVIVNAQPSVGRTYYEGAYVDGQTSAPSCWSADGKTPDASIAKPQSRSCESCPMNVKGSGQNESRACRFSQRLAVVLATDIAQGDVLQLTVPSKSLFGKEEAGNYPLQAYARYFVATKASPDMVVTRLRFDTRSESPKLFFKPVRWLTDAEYAAVREHRNSPAALNAITMHAAALDSGSAEAFDSGSAEAFETEEPVPAPAPAPKPVAKPAAPAPKPAAPAPKPAAPAPKPVAAPKPAPATTVEGVLAEEAYEETPAPTVRRAAAPPLAASLEQVLSDWPEDDA